MGSRRPTSPERVAVAERSRKALELRRGGATFRQIAEALETTVSMAHKDVINGLASLRQEPAEEVLKLELDRLDGLFMTAWGKAQKGDLRAIESCVRLMERRARYLGLDAPEKLDLSGEVTERIELVGVAAEDI